LSEERNNIEGETKREVKGLRMEVEKLKRELEARDMDDSRDQNESKITIATLIAKVQELEQQVTGLRAMLHPKEVESEGLIGFDTSFPSPPSTMPNTPCKHPTSANSRATSATNPDSLNEVINHHQSESYMKTYARGGRERRQATKWSRNGNSSLLHDAVD